MGFSMTILALLARLCVLVQQILFVSVVNVVSSLSQKKQFVKIIQEEVAVYREFYPVNEEYITPECVWSTDKFILFQRSRKSEKKSQEGNGGSDFPIGDPAVCYHSIESFLGDENVPHSYDELHVEKVNAENTARECPTNINENKTNLLADPSIQIDDVNHVDNSLEVAEISGTSAAPDQMFTPEGGLLATSSSSPSSKLLKAKCGTKKVAFVSVKRPAAATSNSLDLHIKEPELRKSYPLFQNPNRRVQLKFFIIFHIMHSVEYVETSKLVASDYGAIL